MSWICGNEPDVSTLTVLPDTGHPNALDLASVELSEAVLNGEDVLIPTSRMWRECYITITKRTYDVRFAWQSTNGGDGAIQFRPDEAWSKLLDIWTRKWPKGIPSFVSYVPADECAPPYKCEASQKQSQPTDFCRYPKETGSLTIDGQVIVELVVGDEIAFANPQNLFGAGRLRVKESENGVEFTLRRADGSEVTFFLATANLGRAEFKQVLETWGTHDIGVVYQDDSGIPAPLSSQHRMVSKDEIPRDTLGLAYAEGTRKSSQVFISAASTMKECSIIVCVHKDYLNITLQRTNWVQEVLYIPLEDERLVKALKHSVGDLKNKRRFGLVQEFSAEAASAYTWDGKVATPRSNQLTASQAVTSANDSICIAAGTFVEVKAGGETYYIDENQLFQRVNAQFTNFASGRFGIDLTYSDGRVEGIIPRSPASEGNFKAEDVLPSWRSVYPDGTTGFIVRRKKRA